MQNTGRASATQILNCDNALDILPPSSASQFQSMGRRALPRIDGGLDLSACHLELAELAPPLALGEQAAPLDLAALFGRAAPTEIEVGTGKGLFLCGAAAQSPERNFLGIEIMAKYARFSAARLVRRELSNAPWISSFRISRVDRDRS